MVDSYFTTEDGVWFQPTDLARGPWDADACHAGPPTALGVRALETLDLTGQRLARLTVELLRPIPMAGFRVTATVRRSGRTASNTHVAIHDDDKTYAELFGLHLTTMEVAAGTAPVEPPDLSRAIDGPFPVRSTIHGLPAFPDSVEVRYDPDSPGRGGGGPTTMWMRAPWILADEEPSPIQRLCPLADCANGISYNDEIGTLLFVNPDINLNLIREPVGEWFASRAATHNGSDGVGVADAQLFDVEGVLGRVTQTLVLRPPG